MCGLTWQRPWVSREWDGGVDCAVLMRELWITIEGESSGDC
jgi:hypothetical protein